MKSHLSPKRRLALAAAAAAVGGVLAWWAFADRWFGSAQAAGAAARLPIAQVPGSYQPSRAIGYLRQLCELGPRPTGSDAMARQRELLTKHFETLGGAVEPQTAAMRHPLTGQNMSLINLIARWNVNAPRRWLLCAHYDTRPYPDRDRTSPRGDFVGANDGASGTAVLMEIAHQLNQLPPDVGVDLVLFDAEEFVFEDGRDDYFLGSIAFANDYRQNPPAVPYAAGVLLDMVGDRELQLLYERNSLRYARDVTKSIWALAKTLGVPQFVAKTRMTEIRDDHLPLNQIAGIPTTDLIDFDYPRPGFGAPRYWHTTEDTPDKCSGESLVAVAYVVHQWVVRHSG